MPCSDFLAKGVLDDKQSCNNSTLLSTSLRGVGYTTGEGVHLIFLDTPYSFNRPPEGPPVTD